MRDAGTLELTPPSLHFCVSAQFPSVNVWTTLKSVGAWRAGPGAPREDACCRRARERPASAGERCFLLGEFEDGQE